MPRWAVELRAGADGPVLWDNRDDDYAFKTDEDALSYGREQIARLKPMTTSIELAGVFVPRVEQEHSEQTGCWGTFEQFVFDTEWEAHQQACRMIAEAVPVAVQAEDEPAGDIEVPLADDAHRFIEIIDSDAPYIRVRALNLKVGDKLIAGWSPDGRHQFKLFGLMAGATVDEVTVMPRLRWPLKALLCPRRVEIRYRNDGNRGISNTWSGEIFSVIRECDGDDF